MWLRRVVPSGHSCTSAARSAALTGTRCQKVEKAVAPRSAGYSFQSASLSHSWLAPTRKAATQPSFTSTRRTRSAGISETPGSRSSAPRARNLGNRGSGKRGPIATRAGRTPPRSTPVTRAWRPATTAGMGSRPSRTSAAEARRSSDGAESITATGVCGTGSPPPPGSTGSSIRRTSAGVGRSTTGPRLRHAEHRVRRHGPWALVAGAEAGAPLQGDRTLVGRGGPGQEPVRDPGGERGGIEPVGRSPPGDHAPGARLAQQRGRHQAGREHRRAADPLGERAACLADEQVQPGGDLEQAGVVEGGQARGRGCGRPPRRAGPG